VAKFWRRHLQTDGFKYGCGHMKYVYNSRLPGSLIARKWLYARQLFFVCIKVTWKCRRIAIGYIRYTDCSSDSAMQLVSWVDPGKLGWQKSKSATAKVDICWCLMTWDVYRVDVRRLMYEHVKEIASMDRMCIDVLAVGRSNWLLGDCSPRMWDICPRTSTTPRKLPSRTSAPAHITL